MRLVIANVGAILLIGVYVFWRRARRPRSLRCFWPFMLVCSLVHASTCHASGRPQWYNGWVVPLPSGVQLPISQCGYGTTVLVLERYSRIYDAVHISKELMPSVDGIRMSDIKRVLSAHGLVAEGRRDVSLEAAGNWVRGSRTVILCVPPPIPQMPMHYVTVVCRADGEKVLLDPPRAVAKFSELDQAVFQRYRDVVALFIDGVDQRGPLSNSVVASVDELVVDSDSVNAGADFSVTLTNSSSKPTMIGRIDTSCGCMRASIEDAFIDSGASVKVTVQPSVAAKQLSRPNRIRMSFPDGSSLAIPVRWKSDEAETVGVHALDIGFVVPAAGSTFGYKCESVYALPRQLSSSLVVSVPTDAVWLSVAATGNSGGSGFSLNCGVCLDEEMLRRVFSGELLRAKCEVLCKDNAACGKLVANVTVAREPSPIVTPPIVSMAEGVGECRLAVGDGPLGQQWQIESIFGPMWVNSSWDVVSPGVLLIRFRGAMGGGSNSGVAKVVLRRDGSHNYIISIPVVRGGGGL